MIKWAVKIFGITIASFEQEQEQEARKTAPAPSTRSRPYDDPNFTGTGLAGISSLY